MAFQNGLYLLCPMLIRRTTLSNILNSNYTVLYNITFYYIISHTHTHTHILARAQTKNSSQTYASASALPYHLGIPGDV